MCKSLIKNLELISIPVVVGQKVYDLGNNPVLNTAKKITGIRTYYAHTAGMKDKDGNALITATTALSAFVEVSTTEKEKPITIPYTELSQMVNANFPQEIKEIEVAKFDANSTKIILGDVSALSSGQVILIGVLFDK